MAGLFRAELTVRAIQPDARPQRFIPEATQFGAGEQGIKIVVLIRQASERLLVLFAVEDERAECRIASNWSVGLLKCLPSDGSLLGMHDACERPASYLATVAA